MDLVVLVPAAAPQNEKPAGPDSLAQERGSERGQRSTATASSRTNAARYAQAHAFPAARC